MPLSATEVDSVADLRRHATPPAVQRIALKCSGRSAKRQPCRWRAPPPAHYSALAPNPASSICTINGSRTRRSNASRRSATTTADAATLLVRHAEANSGDCDRVPRAHYDRGLLIAAPYSDRNGSRARRRGRGPRGRPRARCVLRLVLRDPGPRADTPLPPQPPASLPSAAPLPSSRPSTGWRLSHTSTAWRPTRCGRLWPTF